MDLALNLSLALDEFPLLERPARARQLGFTTVESWWPFAGQAPTDDERTAFIRAVREAGVEMVLFNLPGGGPEVDDRGLLCVPGREDDFLAAARTALSIGREVGATRFNPMVGNATQWGPDTTEFATAVANLVRIDPLVGETGAIVVIEPLSGFPEAAIRSYAAAEQLVRAARAAGAEHVGILADLYHLAVLEDPVLTGSFDSSLIAHVQLADAPGRGWPGTGRLPLVHWVHELLDAGYAGPIGLECGGESLTASAARTRLVTGERNHSAPRTAVVSHRSSGAAIS